MQERRIEESADGATMTSVIDRLSLWMDDEARSGPANMAVDEWLLMTVEEPILRVYRWEPGWGSYGYFVPHVQAAQSLSGIKRVRRWTGGGIVDHRSDWTYTLVLPRGEPLAELRGARSYRVIHVALAKALGKKGVESEMSDETSSTPGGDCFTKAVEFDLMDVLGRKIAGAGQRRTRRGLLHQGSLTGLKPEGLAACLAACLANEVSKVVLTPDLDHVIPDLSLRYASRGWQDRR